MKSQNVLANFASIQVQDYISFIPKLLEYFTIKVSKFKAGSLPNFVEQWQLLTSDDFILDMVTGAHIEFVSPPTQVDYPKEKLYSIDERKIFYSEIKSLLAKGVIVPSTPENGEFVSPIFLTPKKDGSFRFILNIKKFNEHVAYHHFITILDGYPFHCYQHDETTML